MTEILSFFKEIFMISDENPNMKIGLTQLKVKEEEEIVEKPQKVSKEVKISDLMRRSA